MTDPPEFNDAWLQMTDVFKQMVESATGVKAMAIEAGFTEEDASRMGAESFHFIVGVSLKQYGVAA